MTQHNFLGGGNNLINNKCRLELKKKKKPYKLCLYKKVMSGEDVRVFKRRV